MLFARNFHRISGNPCENNNQSYKRRFVTPCLNRPSLRPATLNHNALSAYPVIQRKTVRIKIKRALPPATLNYNAHPPS